ncbi:MAG: TetR/AcrR family transcriptional regulator [Eubacteriales bacterium]
MVRVTDEQKKKIRQSILEVAQKHFTEKGYDKTITKDIAKEVGIAEGTLFNYFDTKTEIFLEAMASGYLVDVNAKDQINYKDGIVDIMYDLVYKTMKHLIKVSKKVIIEIASASLSLAKRKPELMRRIIQLDYNMMDDLAEISSRLIEEKRLKKADPKLYAEVIYAAVVVEIILYLYEDKLTVEEVLQNVKEKIRFTLEGHIL